MKIAVQTAMLVNGNTGDRIFGYGLFESLPGALKDAHFYYHDTHLKPGINVESVNRFQEVDADLALGIFPDSYFDKTPQILIVTSLEYITDVKPIWWPIPAKPNKQLVRILKQASALLVPHSSLRQQLVDQYNIPTAKIHVIGHGLLPGDQCITPADSVTRRITREVYGQEHSYFLAKSTGDPSDNLERLFAAYDLFRQRCPERVRLLIETDDQKQRRKVRKARDRAQHRSDIVFLPELSSAERRKVVSSARALVHVSLSSAFPLPVLDAWTAEVPIVSTDNTILQGAGTLVQGEDIKSIAEGMVALVTTPFLASGLVENGKRRRKDFNWEQVANRVAQVLRQYQAG